jgi:hypothetical protein
LQKNNITTQWGYLKNVLKTLRSAGGNNISNEFVNANLGKSTYLIESKKRKLIIIKLAQTHEKRKENYLHKEHILI